MLSISEVDIKLLFSPRVETEVGLIGEVIDVEEQFHKTRLRNERLRLFRLAAEQSRVFSVAQLCFCIAIYYLRTNRKQG
ncbi:hypothetical protein LSTR_LSTR014195 [Laodelphax striatellus]|uniref:Uncharacterized protein n=1 Tax=Laodelphax striatellus TaxID=195883 RepID=A0A482XLT6_LAOST|nr:hypothetical protein LSTR_LSTR014195 [Laodelphax striatellus]